jgi:hypothetical protein
MSADAQRMGAEEAQHANMPDTCPQLGYPHFFHARKRLVLLMARYSTAPADSDKHYRARATSYIRTGGLTSAQTV